MKTFEEIISSPRVFNPRVSLIGTGTLAADYQFTTGITASVIIAPDEGQEGGVTMDHVSASPYKHRHILTWDELVELKKLCFRADEEAIQVFPKEDEYVHGVGLPGRELRNVMHIWGLPKKAEVMDDHGQKS